MFFRRVFSKKDNPHTFSAPANGRFGNSSSNSPARVTRRTTSDEKQKGLSVLQLTPLWEHIIRTSTLPEGLNIGEMFEEFMERLHDPEWQVRQHALRVLVDVLSVMRQSADVYASRLMASLVENLGHSAPAVRKGALDALRVHISEAAMPETAIIEIIDLGMEQKLSIDNFAGRLAVGVMLALPALIQPALMSVKRNFILRSVLHALSTKMIQITYQEVALKSILKIRDLIGLREFNDFMPYNAKREFELLCKVYGLSGAPNLRDSGIDLNAPSSSESKNSWNNGNGMIKMNGYAGSETRLNSSMKINSNSVRDIDTWHLNSSLKALGNSPADFSSDARNTWHMNSMQKETRNSGTDTSQDNMSPEPELIERPEKIVKPPKNLKRQDSFVKIVEGQSNVSETRQTWNQNQVSSIKNSRDEPENRQAWTQSQGLSMKNSREESETGQSWDHSPASTIKHSRDESENRQSWSLTPPLPNTRDESETRQSWNQNPTLLIQTSREELENRQSWSQIPVLTKKISRDDLDNRQSWNENPTLLIKKSKDESDNIDSYTKMTESSETLVSTEKSSWDLNESVKSNRTSVTETNSDILNSISSGIDALTDSHNSWSLTNSVSQNACSGIDTSSESIMLKKQNSFIKIESLGNDVNTENKSSWQENSPVSHSSEITFTGNTNGAKHHELLSPAIIPCNSSYDSGWQKTSIDQIYEHIMSDDITESRTSRSKTSPVRHKEPKPSNIPTKSPSKGKKLKDERGKSASARTPIRRPSIEVCWKDETGVGIEATACPPNREYDRLKPEEIRPNDKVIMETEIQLSDDTSLTMRILEAQTSQELLTEESEEETSSRSTSTAKQEGVLRAASDSEMDDTFGTDDATPRTPRRVRFGGEIVKMRTPDSDTLHSDVDDGTRSQVTPNSSGQSTPAGQNTPRPSIADKTQTLNIEIPNDNTKPIPTRPKTASMKQEKSSPKSPGGLTKKEKSSPKNSPNLLSKNPPSKASPKILTPTEEISSLFSPKNPKSHSPNRLSATLSQSNMDIRSASASPRRQRRKFSVGKMEHVLSPTPAHREVQVLHNLGRSPSISPTRARKNSTASNLNENMDSPVTQDLSADKHFGCVQNVQTVQTQTSYILPAAIDDDVNGNYELNSEIIKPKQWEDLGIVDNDVIYDLKSGDWRLRSRAFCAIEESLKNTENLALVQPCLDSLLRTLLSSEKHPDVCEDKRRLLSNLISRLPLDNLENRVGQIVTGLCRQGGAGSNRVAKSLMQRLPAAAIVLRLLSDEFLHARSSRFRENALQMVLYALMTFPSTYFDISTCVGRATKAAIDRKKRVRQAALDVLAVLGQISSPKTILDVVNSVVEHRKDGDHLNAAVKARLSRKQLPIVGTDGSVQYSLRIPSPQTNIPSHLFGADIEWIIAGSGSVSPTSIKKRALKIHQQQQQQQQQQQPNFSGKLYENGNSRIIDGSKRFGQRAPHEMLAIGVGVKPNNEFNNNSMGNWTKHSGYHTDDERNSQFIVATAIPIQIPSILAGAPRPLYNMKMQSRSFPELSETGTNKPTKQLSDNRTSQFDGSIIRPSRLPITTTRFPSMEQRSDMKNGHTDNNPYQSFSVQKITKNSNINLPRSNGFTKDSHGNCTLIKQSSLEESRLTSINTSTNLSNNNNKRFYGNKSDVNRTGQFNKTHTISNKYQQTETQAQLESAESPNSDKKGSTRSLVSGTIGSVRSLASVTSKGIVYQSNNNVSASQQNIDVITSSDITSSDSDTSTPTRVIGNSNTILDIQMVENIMQQSSIPLSRPQSVAANLVYNRQDSVEQSRPKTAAMISYDDIPIKSRSTSRDNLVLDDVSLKSRSRSDNSLKSRSASREQLAFDELPIRSRVPSRESVISYDEIIIKSRTASRAPSRENLSSVSRSPFHRMVTPTPNDIDDISSNSIGTRSDTDEDSDDNSARIRSITHSHSNKDINSETYTPKSSRTIKSFASSDIGSEMQDLSPSDEVDYLHTDGIKPLSKSPTRKFKPVVFRSKKVVPVKTSPTTAKAKTNEIRKFDRPREALNICFNQLESTSWEVTMTGLQGFVRLIRYHPELVETQIHLLTVSLAKHVKNLRSQVARAACQAAGEFFLTHRKALELESEDLVTNLLNRTADTNKFLRADAGRALEEMCDNLSPPKVIHILSSRGALHPNAIVRTTSARLFNRLVSRLGCDKVFSLNKESRDKLIISGANLLQEGSLDTRNYAKEMFRQLSLHSSYNKVILDVIPTKVYRNIEKTLKNIR